MRELAVSRQFSTGSCCLWFLVADLTQRLSGCSRIWRLPYIVKLSHIKKIFWLRLRCLSCYTSLCPAARTPVNHKPCIPRPGFVVDIFTGPG